MTTHLKAGDRVTTTDGHGTVRAVAELDEWSRAWFGDAEFCVVLDCGSKFPFEFIPKAQREPPPLSEARMVRYLTGTGEFDQNDPCDEWPTP